MTHRKGARRVRDVSLEVKTALESGTMQTSNLTEWLAVDQSALIQTVFQELGLEQHISHVMQKLRQHASDGVVKRMNMIGQEIAHIILSDSQNKQFINQLITHPSDMVRCWVASAVGCYLPSTLEQKLEAILPLAADSHFGVRECAWMAVRPALAQKLEQGISLLLPWVTSENFRIRRFAVEITRPRGVWCAHITELKQYPERGLRLLEPVRSDKEKYVQDSIANWLNDASKSQPNWVRSVCKRWLQESASSETARIVRRALRTIQDADIKR